MEQMQGMEQNGEARPAYGQGLDEQLAEWSAELFLDPQYRNTWADAEHHWRLESAARTRLIIKKQLREEIEQEMAKELGLPANWRGGNKLKSLAEWHEKMACLAKADAAPRCEHVFQDGTQCGSPRMKTGGLCYAHERMAKVRPKKLNLLAMEDANSIMLNIMEINRALVDEEITEKRAGMLLYSQQLGLQALGKLTFQKTRPELMVVTAEGAENAEEEEVAADPRRKAQIGEEELATDEHRRALIGEELSELGARGMDELSPVDDAMEERGEEPRSPSSPSSREIGERQNLAADSRRHAQIGNGSADGALPPCSSHDSKELADQSHTRESRRPSAIFPQSASRTYLRPD
ncbi:MAG TPA: hypothetical protein VJN64_06570 [Terriglobales bacterium]|nr:hypothetical protein [Terriglobales bacterium]